MAYGQYGKPKQCQNNCGQEIVWDKQASYFINTSNSQRHDCPKWEKKAGFVPNANAAATTTESGNASVLALIEERLTRIETKVDKVEQIGSMANWLQEKVAKKVGVEDLTDDTSSSSKQ